MLAALIASSATALLASGFACEARRGEPLSASPQASDDRAVTSEPSDAASASLRLVDDSGLSEPVQREAGRVRLQPQARIRRTVYVENCGGEERRLSDAITFCGCARLDVEGDWIAPGGRLRVLIEGRPTEAGRFVVEGALRFDHEVVRISLAAEVIRGALFSATCDRLRAAPGHAVALTLIAASVDDAPPDIDDLTCLGCEEPIQRWSATWTKVAPAADSSPALWVGDFRFDMPPARNPSFLVASMHFAHASEGPDDLGNLRSHDTAVVRLEPVQGDP